MLRTWCHACDSFHRLVMTYEKKHTNAGPGRGGEKGANRSMRMQPLCDACVWVGCGGDHGDCRSHTDRRLVA